MVEHILLVGDARRGPERTLKDVLVIKVMRSLDESHTGIGKERHGFLEKACDGNVVRVEHHDQFAIRLGERMVEISGLGMPAGSLDVGRSETAGQLCDLVTMAVVEYIDAFGTIGHGTGADERLCEDGAGL